MDTVSPNRPRLVVLSRLFPNPLEPTAGSFVRERMFRVGRVLPLVVVAPAPWFPGQGLIRRWRPNFRPMPPRYEVQDGFTVYRPRFLSFPGAFKWLDGFLMALGCVSLLRRLRHEFGFDLIDGHFGYPDGYAAVCLGKWFGAPVTITLRGTEPRIARSLLQKWFLVRALRQATRIFAVADSLRRLAVELGVPDSRTQVIANGVDSEVFTPLPKSQARVVLDLPIEAPILVSVGTLVPRKGFHRVIECLPELLKVFPNLRYLIVGGAGPEGDWCEALEKQVRELGLQDTVHFLGPMPPEQLNIPLSAADVFVLATANEGWANVFLEAMACGLPVVATAVGGNTEVVCKPELGVIVPFGDKKALTDAMLTALRRSWNAAAIIEYARQNNWDSRIAVLLEAFTALWACWSKTRSGMIAN